MPGSCHRIVKHLRSVPALNGQAANRITLTTHLPTNACKNVYRGLKPSRNRDLLRMSTNSYDTLIDRTGLRRIMQQFHQSSRMLRLHRILRKPTGKNQNKINRLPYRQRSLLEDPEPVQKLGIVTSQALRQRDLHICQRNVFEAKQMKLTNTSRPLL